MFRPSVEPAIIPISSVHKGSVLVCDGGFTCLRNHELVVVNGDTPEDYWIRCKEGEHTLIGQESWDGKLNYVGFWHYKEVK